MEEPAPLTEPTPPKQKNVKLIALVTAGIGLLVIALLFFIYFPSNKSANQTSSAQAAFDKLLTAAASKSLVQLTYTEQAFSSKADFEAKKVDTSHYSVAELDATTKDYRAVYANQVGAGTTTYYTVRRCLDGKMFAPDSYALGLKTIDDVKNVLKQPFMSIVPATKTESEDCNLNDPDHLGRLSDGIIPIGLNQQQIGGWLKNLRESNFVKVEDAGTTTFNQKTVRKLHFTTSSIAGVASFFDAVQKGAGLQLTTNKGDVGSDAYRFDEMATSDNIDGFYLVDQQTNLPVYSEFTSLGLLQSADQKGSVLKQTYAYPQALTLSQSSTINTLE